MHYREDPDQQNLIDWLQSSWECCGIDSPSDWDQNLYFNCTSSILGSREACGVPFSCCKTNSNDIITNKVRDFELNVRDLIDNLILSAMWLRREEGRLCELTL